MKLIKRPREQRFYPFLIQNHFTVKNEKAKLMLKRSQFQPLFSKKESFIEKDKIYENKKNIKNISGK